MKDVSKSLIVVLALLSSGITAQAQEKKLAFSGTAGLVIMHDGELGFFFQDPAYGGHLGFNIYPSKPKRLKPEGQLSMNFSRLQNTTTFSVNGLGGIRYYIVKPEKPTSVFFNVLGGAALVSENGDDFVSTFIDVGYSVGCFVNINRLLMGGSVESYNNYIIKVGYTF